MSGNNHTNANAAVLDRDEEISSTSSDTEQVESDHDSMPVSNDSDAVELTGERSEPSVGAEGGETNSEGSGGLELADPTAELAISAEPALGAWLAEYGTDQELERARVITAPEVIIGRDDRIRISHTSSYPWRTICSLRITAADGTNWIGTGFLVGARVVITAGHVVFMRNNGGWVRQIEVIPGRNGTDRPFDSCVSRQFSSVRGFVNDSGTDFDYGAIVLPENCPYGKRVGFFGYANYPKAQLDDAVVNLAGYPGDKGGSTLWWHSRRLTAVGDRRLKYNIDTMGGQSGAPVWRVVNRQRYAVGIHTTGHLSGNGATRVNSSVFQNITNWKKQHH